MFNRILSLTATVIALTGCGRPVTQHWGATVTDSGTTPETSTPSGPGLEWSPKADKELMVSGYNLTAVDDNKLFLDGIADQDPTPGLLIVGALYSVSGEEILTVKIDQNYFSGMTEPLIGDVNGDGQDDMFFAVSDPEAADWALSSGYALLLSPFEGGEWTLGKKNFEPSGPAAGVFGGRLVPNTVEDGVWLDQGTTGDLNGDGLQEFVGASSDGRVWFVTDEGQTAMTGTPSGTVTALTFADLNNDGFYDLLINNAAEDIGLDRGWTAQAPQIFLGPIDPLNPPAWTDGMKVWPTWNMYNDEDSFIPQGVIGALPPLADGTACWLASGYTWITADGANSALAEICAQDDWTPRELITAPSNAAVWFDNRNTLVIGKNIVTTTSGGGQMDPENYYRRPDATLTWDLPSLLGR